MNDAIRVRKADGTWVVRAGGAVIGETSAALELERPGAAPAIFFPEADIAMAFLDPKGRGPEVPGIGATDLYAIVTKSTVLDAAAWALPAPEGAAAALAGHIAFHPDETVTVERL